MRIVFLSITFFISLIISGCSAPAPASIYVEPTSQKISYLQDVKPILDRRCVSCHSCYNSPCQAKFSAFEGIDRGASKIEVYHATRLRAIDPTRLFIDATTTPQWRDKGFYTITQSSEQNRSKNNSIMLELLHDKKQHPEIIGDYAPEDDELICPKNQSELGTYFQKKPNHGMPYGFPALKEREYQTLAHWLHQGAKGPTQAQQKRLTTPSSAAALKIKAWEAFLNGDDAKHQLTARYLYEHLFLAHVSFDAAPDEFYTLVRSQTKAPEPIDPIVTLRPFDDPKVARVYYRFERIHSTIVHKTHMVFALNDAKLERYKALFIASKWDETPHTVGYDVHIAANPFKAFSQIPPQVRYQFLLDNSHYIVMTFIRGPVCRGQIALNVIHDHFWVMFKDPNYDLTLLHPEFLKTQADNLSMPIESRDQAILSTFSDAYRLHYYEYALAKRNLYQKYAKEGNGYESVWKGERAEDAPVLTIYRHFDSASVHKGLLGKEPRTMWVIDYPQLERIYYTLVAGYDVFGNVSHQTNIRRYMDFLRMEGEENFVSYMPKEERLKMIKSWYIGDDDAQGLEHILAETQETKIDFKTQHPKNEFITHLVEQEFLPSTQIAFDEINYFKVGEALPELPQHYKGVADFIQAVRALSRPGTGFITYAQDHGVNVMLLRIKMEDGQDIVDTLVLNRWHDNVNSLFSEEDRLHASKDTLDIIKGSVGSYPNVFIELEERDVPDFIDLMKSKDAESAYYVKKFKKYFISRSDPRFWESYDWFQNHFNQSDPRNAGLYDLNRYYRAPW